MAIGTSLGAYFEDTLSHQAGIEEVIKPKDTGDDNVSPPDPDSYKKDTAQIIPIGFMDKLMGTNGEERHQLWPERMVRDLVNTAHDVGAGKVPMWGMDPETGDYHTSIEGLEAAHSLMPAASGGMFPKVTIQLHPEATTALQEGPDVFQQFMATRGRRQESNIYSDVTREEIAHETQEPPYQPHYPVGRTFEQEPWHPEDFNGTSEADLVENLHNFAEERLSVNKSKIEDAKQKFVDNPNVVYKGDMSLLKDDSFSGSPGLSHYNFLSEGGVPGELSLRTKRGGKELYVTWIGKVGGQGPNEVGRSEMKNLFKLLAEQFPYAEEITGFRVSGARAATGKVNDARMRIPGR